MIYTNPVTNERVDTNGQPTKQLVNAIFYLDKYSMRFVTVNGAGSLEQLVRAVRARLFRERDLPRGYLRAIMNRLDPPKCRCGKPGTRIIGGTTFCTKCGPTKIASRIVQMESNSKRR